MINLSQKLFLDRCHCANHLECVWIAPISITLAKTQHKDSGPAFRVKKGVKETPICYFKLFSDPFAQPCDLLSQGYPILEAPYNLWTS